jgi:hypothetical protein
LRLGRKYAERSATRAEWQDEAAASQFVVGWSCSVLADGNLDL